MIKFRARKFILAMAVIGLLIFLHWLKILSPIESVINKSFEPMLKQLYLLSLNFQPSNYEKAERVSLIEKIKQLEVENSQLIIDNTKLKILEEENQVLRQNLKFLSKSQFRYVMADIISRNEIATIDKDSQTIIINKGLNDGLSAGLAVISPIIYGDGNQGVIIGKVVAVKENTAEVYLATNRDCKIAVSLFNQTKTSGLVHGELGLTIKMEFISQIEDIKSGDIVITSGLEKNIPRGLVVGKVTEVNKDSNELWQNAIIEPLSDFSKLTIVAVLLP